MVITPVKGSSTSMISATASMRGLLMTNIATEATSSDRTTMSSVFMGNRMEYGMARQTQRLTRPVAWDMLWLRADQSTAASSGQR